MSAFALTLWWGTTIIRRMDYGEESQEGEEGKEGEAEGQERRLGVTPLQETQRALATVRASTNKVLVAYSDGKDARVVMDLATKTFDQVEAFFMYFVPGITHLEKAISEATERWGVRVHFVPHPAGIQALKHGFYCNAAAENEYELPDLSFFNVYASMIKLTGIPVVLTGFKRADSNSRRRFMAWSTSNTQVIHPIAGWKKRDVLTYLQLQGIPIPQSTGKATTGLDLSDAELFQLHDLHPEDWDALLKYFPFAEALIKRREMFGG